MAVKYSYDFLERRLSEHQRWQHDVEKELLQEAMVEMAEALRTPAFAKRAEAQVLPFPDPEQWSGRGPQRFVRAR